MSQTETADEAQQQPPHLYAEDFPEAVVDGVAQFFGKPRLRGWIHVYAAVVAFIAGAALVSVSWSVESTRAGLATLLLIYLTAASAAGRLAGTLAALAPLQFYFFVARGGRDCATDAREVRDVPWRRLVADLCMPVEILAVPVVREHDGLACGARNRHLSTRDRHVAARLNETLKLSRRRLIDGERNFAAVAETGARELDRGGLRPDYYAIRQAGDLMPPRHDSRDLVILAAANLGLTRLVDCLRVQLPA